MDGCLQQRVVVVVEEADASRAALQWAVRSFLRPGDSITLLYAFPSSRSRKKQRALRLRGFQLALSFKELCAGIPEAKVEIVVTEGDLVAVIVSLVNEIRAAALVLGLHDQSCLYRMTAQNLGQRELNCRILAVKQQQQQQKITSHDFITIEFTQVELARLCIRRPKIRYRILPTCPWKTPKKRKGRGREREGHFFPSHDEVN